MLSKDDSAGTAIRNIKSIRVDANIFKVTQSDFREVAVTKGKGQQGFKVVGISGH